MMSPAGSPAPTRTMSGTTAALLVGIAAGVAGAYVGELRTAWIGFILFASICATVLLATRDILRLIGIVFVLSLQADAAYRLLYGHASSEGIALPLTVLVGFAWVVFWWLTASRSESRRIDWGGPLAIPIWIMLGAMALAWVFSSEHFVGLTALLFHLELYFVFLITLQLARTVEDIDWLLRWLMVVLAMQCVVYFIQSALGISFTLEGDTIEQGIVARPGGTVSTNPAGFASFAIPIVMVAMARFLRSPRRNERRYLAVLTFLGVIAVGLTFTRVAWAGLVFAAVMLVMTTWRRGFLPARGIAWIGLALALMVGVLAPGIYLRNEEAPLEDAYSERHGLMRIAFEVIRAHPLTGVGPGAYPYVYKRHLPEDLDDQWLFTVHNEYLLRTAESGVIGGAAWVLLLIAAFRLAIKVSRSRIFELQTLGLGWSAGLLALAWQMYWVPWDGFQYNALLWFFMALTVAAQRQIEAAR